MGVCQHEKTAALNIEFKNSFDLNITQTIKPTFTARVPVIQCIDHVVMTFFFSKLVQRSSPYILVIIDGYLLKYMFIYRIHIDILIPNMLLIGQIYQPIKKNKPPARITFLNWCNQKPH